MSYSITTDIIIPDYPIETNYGQWAYDHPECDTIMKLIGTGPIMLVYAYSGSKHANKELRRLRDERFADKRILQGVPRYGDIREVIIWYQGETKL